MSSHAFMLLQGQKVQMEVHPDEINTVAVSLEDGTTFMLLQVRLKKRN